MDPRYLDGRRPAVRHSGGPPSGAAPLPPRRGALAPDAVVGEEQGPRLRPQSPSPTRARIVALSTDPPEGATVVGVDELGPVTPRHAPQLPPAPGWSPDAHRIKVPLDNDRGLEQVWVSGALRVRDGPVLTPTAPA